MIQNKKGEWLSVLILINGLASCFCEGGWTAYHPPQGQRNLGRRHRNAPIPMHGSYQGQYDSPHPYSLHVSNQGAPVDLAYYATNHNHRQGHSFGGPPRYSNQLPQANVFHAPTPDYHSFGPTSYSSLSRDTSIPEHDHASHSPLIITSRNPHFLDDAGSPYSSSHSSIVTASPLSLGPSHAGFLSASSSFRVADHLAKPSIKKGYKVTENESEDDIQRSSHINPYPNHRQHDSHIHSSNDRSSSSHPSDSKATSFQSFVLHSYKPVKVLPKKSHDGQDTESNEISHKH